MTATATGPPENGGGLSVKRSGPATQKRPPSHPDKPDAAPSRPFAAVFPELARVEDNAAIFQQGLRIG
jgi:hypothetical protein